MKRYRLLNSYIHFSLFHWNCKGCLFIWSNDQKCHALLRIAIFFMKPTHWSDAVSHEELTVGLLVHQTHQQVEEHVFQILFKRFLPPASSFFNPNFHKMWRVVLDMAALFVQIFVTRYLQISLTNTYLVLWLISCNVVVSKNND